jgi:viroplasmin and RNaseH domain-containing protein
MGKVYVVFEGRVPGVYQSWPIAWDQVKNWSNNSHIAYDTLEEAEQAYEDHCKRVGRPYTKTTNKNSREKGECSYSSDSTQQYTPQSCKFLYYITNFPYQPIYIIIHYIIYFVFLIIL